MKRHRAWGWLWLVLCAVSGCGGGPAPSVDGSSPDGGSARCAVDLDCDDGLFCSGVEHCAPTDPSADARGCVGTPACGVAEQCEEAMRRCVRDCTVRDGDGDGHDVIACGGDDCDDTLAAVHPGVLEVCDAAGRDEDCDPVTIGDRDADGDGFIDAACCNGTLCGDDCHDQRRDVHPGASEVCDTLDGDCDGSVDEMLLVPSYVDRDFDLHGVAGAPVEVCPGTPGYSTVGDDCDDADFTRHGGQPELCDRVDNDCDTVVDETPTAVAWYPDDDGDLFGAIPADPSRLVVSCELQPGLSLRATDCDDSRAEVHPGAREECNGRDDDCNGRADARALTAGDGEDDDLDGRADVVCGGADCDDARADVGRGSPELCDGVDNDCDGTADVGSASVSWYVDADRDGFGDETASGTVSACDPVAAHVTRGGDCDDGSAAVHPDAPDLCGGGDADCDGSVDEDGARHAVFVDLDRDGYGDGAAAVVFACSETSGTSDVPGDCDDTSAAVGPEALEQCNGEDDDCDGTLDEDAMRDWFVDADGDGHGAIGSLAVRDCLMPPGRAPIADDCDDTAGARYPGHAEGCDAVDEDCDGTTDEGAGASCGDGVHSTGVCTAGRCALTCASGFADCDLQIESGCETDTRSTPTACGSCTLACNPGDGCGHVAPSTCDRSPAVSIGGGENWSALVRANGNVVVWGASDATGTTTYTYDLAAPAPTTLGDVRLVEGSSFVGIALTRGGLLYAWGYAANGQLGDGSTTGRATPRPVPISNVVDADVGVAHVCAVLGDGSVWCWGASTAGQVGDGTTMTRPRPVQVAGIADATAVRTFGRTTCVLRGTPGARYVTCWGENANGQLGLGAPSTTPQLSPGAPVLGLPTDLIELARATAESDAACARASDGRAYCWGYNYGGVGLGMGPASPQTLATATPIPGLTDVTQIALAQYGGCVRRRGASGTGGEVWCFGYEVTPWIDGAGNNPTPTRVGGSLSDAVWLYAADERWCAVRSDGSALCAGSDSRGGLGNDLPLSSQLAPAPIAGIP